MFCCHVEAEKGTDSEENKFPHLPLLADSFSNRSYSIIFGFACFHSLSQIIRQVRNTFFFHDLLLYWYLLPVSKIL